MFRVFPCWRDWLALTLLSLGLPLFALSQQAHPAKPSAAPLTAVLLSDPHLDPFRDPAKAKRLAAAEVDDWAAILASPPSADAEAQYTDLQKTCNEKLSDAETSLELSSFDDAKAAKPAVVLVGGDMLVHAFGCRYKTLLDPTGTDAAGLADFARKTVVFQLKQMQQRFPDTPIHLALGNNDSDCEDYALDEDSRFLKQLAESVAAGWVGVSAQDRVTALQDFKRFGSYALPLSPALPRARLVVLDDLYLSSDYRGTCGKKQNSASSTALLAWLSKQLAQAKRAHQAVWVLAHIPPEVNIYRTYLHPHDICNGEPPVSYFLAANTFNNLLTQYAGTVRVFISGHTHVDEIHLLKGLKPKAAAVALKTIPSISPISTNAPAYLRAAIDGRTATLLDYELRTASTSSGPDIQWTTAYTFRKTYSEPAFTARSVTDLLQRWQKSPENSAEQINNYQTHVATGLRLLALRLSWPQQLCAMQHSSAVGFASCACSVKGGLLPPAQSAK